MLVFHPSQGREEGRKKSQFEMRNSGFVECIKSNYYNDLDLFFLLGFMDIFIDGGKRKSTLFVKEDSCQRITLCEGPPNPGIAEFRTGRHIENNIVLNKMARIL